MRIVSKDKEMEKKRNLDVSRKVEGKIAGEMVAYDFERKNGAVSHIELDKPMGEMITTDDIKSGLLKKIIFDVEEGKESTPILYKPIYDTMIDKNFPKLLEATAFQGARCVFLKHLEGEEVQFGELEGKDGPTVKIEDWATGFEYTKEMVDYNETWKFELLNKSVGEAYNMLLNHIHFFPFINYTKKGKFKAENKTGAVKNGDDPVMWLRDTIKQGLVDTAKARRKGTILLTSSANEFDIEEALSSRIKEGTNYKDLSGKIDTIIYYDGDEITVGGKTYTYPGIDDGKAYLIRPKKGFKELIKKDLTTEKQDGDLSRLIEEQFVAYARRGLYAYLDNNVQEITLP